MKFAYTIIYVPDVEKALAFYEGAFGLKRRFIDEKGQYGELDTGATTLSFAVEELAYSHFDLKVAKNDPATPPPGIEVAFTVDDVAAAYSATLSAGCTAVAEPEQKPWGQTVSYVRDLNGVLVEICSPVGG